VVPLKCLGEFREVVTPREAHRGKTVAVRLHILKAQAQPALLLRLWQGVASRGSSVVVRIEAEK
jgi:hypothetical protein